MNSSPTFFKRFLLPGFAFKAVVIGGGYATGRELVEFFFPSGPRGGLAGMAVTMVVWSVVCALTFSLAYQTRSYDYRAFFYELLGKAWWLFEVAYVALVVLVLSVFGAAAGEIAQTVFGLPAIAGTLALTCSIALVVTFGNSSVERIFKYVSFFLYGVYIIFVLLAAQTFGDRIASGFALNVPSEGWLLAGLTYSGYNLVGAIVILPVVRHLTSRRDAVISGMLCGPLAILPAMLFFACMVAYYPEVGKEALPSNFLLERLGFPAFRLLFEAMVLAALLESGSGLVHSINQRVSSTLAARNRRFPEVARAMAGLAILIVSIFVATRFGLVALIARGYATSAYVFLALFVLPLVTIGAWRVLRGSAASPARRAPSADSA